MVAKKGNRYHMPRRCIVFRYHPQYARHRAMGTEPRYSLFHITEFYLVRDHPPARVPPIPKAVIRAWPPKSLCRRHRGHLNRPCCCELHQNELIRFDILQKDDSMSLAFRQTIHNVTCYDWRCETATKGRVCSFTRYDRHILRQQIRSRRAGAVVLGEKW